MKAGWTILYGPANASCAKGGSKGNFIFPWYVENSSSSFFMAAQTIQLHLVTRSMTETPKKYDIMTSSVFSFQKLCKILNWNTFQSSEVCDNLETCVSFTMDLMCVCVCVQVQVVFSYLQCNNLPEAQLSLPHDSDTEDEATHIWDHQLCHGQQDI